MPKQSSERPNYSVDEMMEKLRDGEREKEELASSRLVTRPDGSQVLKVKRRKRRSQQPKHEAEDRRKKRGLLWISMVFGFFVLLGIVVVLLVARFNSSSYQKELSENAGQAVGGKVYFDRMAVTPLRARAREASLKWPESSALRTLKLNDITADLRITSLFGAAWNGPEVFAREGVLRLAAPVGGPSPKRAPAPFRFDQMRCGALTIAFGMGDSPPLVLRGTEATLRPSEDGVAKLLLKRGEALIRGMDPMKMDFGGAVMSGGALELRALRLAVDEIEGVEGELEFRSPEPLRPNEPLILAAEARNFPMSRLVGTGLGQLMDAVVNGKNGTVIVENWDFDSLEARIELAGHTGRLREFRFLDSLQAIFGDTDFGKPHFSKVSGIYSRDGTGVRIEKLEMEHEGQLVVRGAIQHSAGGRLSGKLQLGIRPSRIMAANGRKRYAAFSNPADGYCWITIELSGTPEKPQDNFSAILHSRPAGGAGGGGPLEDIYQPLPR
ncbi:MAG: hypothetical protein HKN82_10290 [Akkermansiaceae bacterium]|nr:hypothetical protein [Akkermansiaceae bacterium]NNM31323.1 hypothetical protein [Akkermansiaceae bacterium]